MLFFKYIHQTYLQDHASALAVIGAWDNYLHFLTARNQVIPADLKGILT